MFIDYFYEKTANNSLFRNIPMLVPPMSDKCYLGSLTHLARVRLGLKRDPSTCYPHAAGIGKASRVLAWSVERLARFLFWLTEQVCKHTLAALHCTALTVF